MEKESMMIARYLVVATDIGDSSSIKPHVIAAFSNEEDAYGYAIDEMREMIDSSTSDEGKCEYVIDDKKMCVHDAGYKRGCQFTVILFETQPSKAELQHAEQRRLTGI